MVYEAAELARDDEVLAEELVAEDDACEDVEALVEDVCPHACSASAAIAAIATHAMIRVILFMLSNLNLSSLSFLKSDTLPRLRPFRSNRWGHLHSHRSTYD